MSRAWVLTDDEASLIRNALRLLRSDNTLSAESRQRVDRVIEAISADKHRPVSRWAPVGDGWHGDKQEIAVRADLIIIEEGDNHREAMTRLPDNLRLCRKTRGITIDAAHKQAEEEQP